tara:strand:+ start:26765 stop:27457 length:693 start_codon:yes stop_codon:yes gene_type:complete
MFKRRTPLSYWEWFKEGFYPRAGWRRVINYTGYRLKRLPDSPHRISLGFACGAFASFSPLFGLHFFLAAFLAYVLRGNVLSALIGTFFGNPITFPFIGVISYRTGLFLMGMGPEETAWHKIRNGIGEMFGSVWSGVKNLFGYGPTTWNGFVDFFHSVFVPYLIGGLIPGFITAIVIYFVTKPLVRAYQARRKGRLIAKINEIREKREAEAALRLAALEAAEKDKTDTDGT